MSSSYSKIKGTRQIIDTLGGSGASLCKRSTNNYQLEKLLRTFYKLEGLLVVHRFYEKGVCGGEASVELNNSDKGFPKLDGNGTASSSVTLA